MIPNGTAQTAMSSTSPDAPPRATPDGVVEHAPRPPPTGHPALLGDQHRGDDPGDDAQRVGPDRQRSEFPDALGGAGQGGEHRHARTPRARSSDRARTPSAPRPSSISRT